MTRSTGRPGVRGVADACADVAAGIAREITDREASVHLGSPGCINRHDSPLEGR